MAVNVIPKEHIKDFIFAGNAYFTLTSNKTKTHYTYRIKKANNNNNTYFINVDDNNRDTYAGYMKRVDNVFKFFKGTKGAFDELDEPIIALMWTIRHSMDVDINTKITIQHVGKCCKCGRTLSDPKSINMGIGPECMKLAYKTKIYTK